MAEFVPLQSYRPLLNDDDDAYHAPISFGGDEDTRTREAGDTRTREAGDTRARGEAGDTRTRGTAQKSEGEGNETVEEATSMKQSSTYMEDVYTPQKKIKKTNKGVFALYPTAGTGDGAGIGKANASMYILNADVSHDSGLYSSPFSPQSSSPMITTPCTVTPCMVTCPMVSGCPSASDTDPIGRLDIDQCSPDRNTLDTPGATSGRNLASTFQSLNLCCAGSPPVPDVTPLTQFIVIPTPSSSSSIGSRSTGIGSTLDSAGSTRPPDSVCGSGGPNGQMSPSGSEEGSANGSDELMSTHSGVSDLSDPSLLVCTLNESLTPESNSSCIGSNSSCPETNSSYPEPNRKRKSVGNENVDPKSFLGTPVTPVTIRRHDDPGAPFKESIQSRRILRPKYRSNRVAKSGAEVVTEGIPTPVRSRSLFCITKRPSILRVRSDSPVTPPIKQRRMFMEIGSGATSKPVCQGSASRNGQGSVSVSRNGQGNVSKNGQRRLPTKRREELCAVESDSRDDLSAPQSSAEHASLPLSFHPEILGPMHSLSFHPEILGPMHLCEQVPSRGLYISDGLRLHVNGEPASIAKKRGPSCKKRSLSARDLSRHPTFRAAGTGRRARSVSPRSRSVCRRRSQSRSRNNQLNRLKVSTCPGRSTFRSKIPVTRVFSRSHPYSLDQRLRQSFTGSRSHVLGSVLGRMDPRSPSVLGRMNPRSPSVLGRVDPRSPREEYQGVKRSVVEWDMERMREIHGRFLPDDTAPVHVDRMSESIVHLSIRDDPS